MIKQVKVVNRTIASHGVFSGYFIEDAMCWPSQIAPCWVAWIIRASFYCWLMGFYSLCSSSACLDSRITSFKLCSWFWWGNVLNPDISYQQAMC